MKSLFQSIRSGIITKAACESQLLNYKSAKIQLSTDYLARKIGLDLYTKKLAELNFCIEMLASIVDKYDDLRRPLKTKPQTMDNDVDGDDNTNPIELPFNEAFDQVSGRALDDEGPNFPTEC